MMVFSAIFLFSLSEYLVIFKMVSPSISELDVQILILELSVNDPEIYKEIHR